jgi:hypothetical protein
LNYFCIFNSTAKTSIAVAQEWVLAGILPPRPPPHEAALGAVGKPAAVTLYKCHVIHLLNAIFQHWQGERNKSGGQNDTGGANDPSPPPCRLVSRGNTKNNQQGWYKSDPISTTAAVQQPCQCSYATEKYRGPLPAPRN